MRLPVQLRTRTPRVNPITEIVDSDGKVIAVVLTPQIGPAIVAAINHADALEAALREAREAIAEAVVAALVARQGWSDEEARAYLANATMPVVERIITAIAAYERDKARGA